MRALNHVLAACKALWRGFVSICTSSSLHRVGARAGLPGTRDPCGTRLAAAPLLAGSSKKQTTPLLRLASRRSSARRWPDDFRRPAPVLGRSMTGRNVASESQALGKSVPRRRRRLGSTGATAASPATLSAPRMAPCAVRDNTQHARHAAAAPTDWRAHPRGRRATNWTHFVVERTQILTSRAGVVLRAAGSGDGVARLLARGHGSGGGGIGDGVCADLMRKRSARSCCARRTLRLGPMVCRGGRVDDVVLGSQQERASLSNGALRRAPVACACYGVSQLWRGLPDDC